MTDPAPRARQQAPATPIDEGAFVPIDGVPQWVTIRGRDRANPALVIVTGPGAAFSAMAPFFAPWEEAFTLVQWDQPGAGATCARNGPQLPLTIARLARDGLEVSAYACARLGLANVILLGVSGGTIVALSMIRQRPDLFGAYVGTGQIVDWPAQDARSYQMALAEARRRADMDAVAALEAIGPPPYRDAATDAIKSTYAGALTPAELAEFTPDMRAAIATPPPGAHYVPRGLAPFDQRAQALAAYTALRDEITSFDARADGMTFAVPVYFIQGELDAYTTTPEVAAFCQDVRAPARGLTLTPGGGHSALFLRATFLAALRAHLA